MTQMEKAYYEKRGQIMVKNLRSRHFDAWYCDSKEDALAKVLELIPEGAKIGWGGVLSAQQIGLFDALRVHGYDARLMKLFVMGGGGCLVKNFGKYDPGAVVFVDDLHASAKGYEYMAQGVIGRNERLARKAGD